MSFVETQTKTARRLEAHSARPNSQRPLARMRGKGEKPRSQTTPLLFINKDRHSDSLSRSKGEAASSINRHVQRWRARQVRQNKHESTDATSQPAPDIIKSEWTPEPGSTDSDLQSSVVSSAVTDTSSSTEGDTPTSEDYQLIASIIGAGQAADPFSSTPMSVAPEALRLIQFWQQWTSRDAQIHALALQRSHLGADQVPSGSELIVRQSMNDDLHMAALLAYVSCFMEHRRFGNVSSKRTTVLVQHALEGLQERLRTSQSSDVELLYDISFLSYAALFRQEEHAALTHLKAVKFIVDSIGGFNNVPNHLIGRILYPDLQTSVSRMIRPIFDLSTPEYQHSQPAMPWTCNRSLELVGQMMRNRPGYRSLDSRNAKFIAGLIQVAQVLESCRSHPEQSANMYWAMWRCLTIVSSLLSPPSTTPTLSTTPSAEYVADLPETRDFRCPDHRAEVTRITILLWTLWLGATPMGRVGTSDFIPKFKDSVMQAYKARKFHKLHDALHEWDRVLWKLAGKMQADEDWLFSALAEVIRKLEVYGNVQLGEFMNHFLSLEKLHRAKRSLKSKYGHERIV